MKVLVTGGKGQLGQAIQALTPKYTNISFYFADSSETDITSIDSLDNTFNTIKPDYCINAAAYTAVDKAESEQESAYAVNVTGAKNLAQICKKYGTVLLHVSTDFVFDGNKETPYTEEDKTDPKGVYGLTKRDGEEEIQKNMEEYYIVRTAWVYSEYANNFMKTMIRLGKERDSLNIVSDQIGSPTNANDLADALIQIILSGKKAYGIYHFSNEGIASWYEFACEIFKVNNIEVQANPIPSSAYPTPATRPAYSLLDKSKIKNIFGIHINDWKESLKPYKG
jgi:dTDP-4-dehydrorhamnose reductase